MIPVLYPSTETVFVNNGLGGLPDAISCVVTEQRNTQGGYYLEMDYPIDGLHYADIAPERIIYAAPFMGATPQPFRISRINRPINGIVHIEAPHISVELQKLTTFGTSIGTNIGAMGRGFFAKAREIGQSTHFDFASNVTASSEITISHPEPVPMIDVLLGAEGSILDLVGGEYEFDEFDVVLHAQRGVDSGLEIRYGVNMSDLEAETDATELVTACVPFWKGTVNEQDVIVTGDMCEADNADAYAYVRCVPLDVTEQFDLEQDTQPSVIDVTAKGTAFINSTSRKLLQTSIRVKYEPTTSGIGERRINLCDTVRVVYPDLNVSSISKVVETRFNVLTEQYDELTIGSIRNNIVDTIAGLISGGAITGGGGSSGGGGGSAVGAVLYNMPQSLNEAQKAQARSNIGIGSGGDVEVNFPVYTPQDFGAVGDGVTDDTAAVQAALNADGAVFFPAGTYLTDAITVTHDSTRLYGCGEDSVIKLSGGSSNLLTANGKNDLLIQSLSFDASRGTATTDASTGSVSGADAIRLERCENAVIRDVTANKAPRTGIFSSNCKNLLIEKCTANESEHYAGIAVATNINADAKEHTASIENGNFRFDGASQFILENPVFTVQNPIFLFACNENGTAGHYSNGMRIESAVFSRNGATIANFVPRIRNSDSELGMLDTVSGVFFTNDGEGSFKNDSASVGSGTYTEIDFIESDGASYINTGILPSADLDVVVKFSHASIDSITSAARQYVFGTYSRDGENAVVGRYQFYCSGSENSGISFAGWGGGGSEAGFRNFWVTADVNASVLDCVCCDNDLDGILCVSPNTVIARCVCNRNGIAKNPGDKVACGIYLSKRSNMTVKDCVINSNYALGIEGNDIFNCKILDNSICNNRLSGIHCYAQLNNPSFNNVISHNSCIGNARGQTEYYGGILLSAFGAAPSTDCRYNIVSENTCKGNKYGLIIRYTDHTKLLDNITTDNEVDVHLHANTNYKSLVSEIKEVIQDSTDLIEAIADAELVEQLYEKLDYLESDGSSYIDTGIIPSATTRITARFKMASTAAYNTAARQYVFGTYDLENGSAESRVQFFYGGSDSGQRSFAGFGASTQYTALTPDADEHLVTMNADSVVFDSGAWVKTFDSIVFTNPRPIYLFACNEDGTVDHFSKGMQIMAVSIYDGNTRIARFVPALRKADGALGMLDEDSGEFFPNMGTGTFRNDTIEPECYNVTLNADGTVNTVDSALNYNSAAASVLNGKPKKLIVTWGNTLFTADADEKLSGANGDVKFICDVEHDGIQRHMIFTLTSSNALQTTLIETYSRVPAVVWEVADVTQGLIALNTNISSSLAWQLTNLNLSPFKRIKVYAKAGRKTGAAAQDSSIVPAVIIEMLLDDRAKETVSQNVFIGSAVVQNPNDANRLGMLTCAVSSDKTKFAVVRATSLYGTAATSNTDCYQYVFKIEGYYD